MNHANKIQNKKSQVFIFDFITSFVIIIIAIVVLLSYFQSTTDNVNIYELNLEIIDSFTTTKINELNNDEIRIMFASNLIQNIQNTVAQQVGEFYFRGGPSYAGNLTDVFISDLVTQQMNVNVTLYNESFSYSLYTDTKISVSFDEAEISSSTDRLIFGTYRGSSYSYNVRLDIWQ